MIHPLAFPTETDALAGSAGTTGEAARQAYRTVRPANDAITVPGFRTVANDDAAEGGADELHPHGP